MIIGNKNYGILLESTLNITVESSLIDNNQHGMRYIQRDTSTTDYISIISTTISGSRSYGIYISNARKVMEINHGSSFIGNSYGLYIHAQSSSTDGDTRVKIMNSSFTDSTNYGIYMNLRYVSTVESIVEIIQCSFSNNNRGVYVYGYNAGLFKMESNNFETNSYGIQLYNSRVSTSTLIKESKFVGSKYAAIYFPSAYGNITIVDCVFTQNKDTITGESLNNPLLTISGNTFTDGLGYSRRAVNYLSFSNMGELNIRDNIFRNNSVTSVVSVSATNPTSIPVITNNIFENPESTYELNVQTSWYSVGK